MAKLVLGTDKNNTGTSSVVRDLSPEFYIEYPINSSTGYVSKPNKIADFSKIKYIDTGYIFSHLYSYTYERISGKVDMHNLISISNGSSCQEMFSNSYITEVDLSSLKYISGTYATKSMFSSCTYLTSVDLSSLKQIGNVNGSDMAANMFYGCTSLSNINLNSLMLISQSNSANCMFYNCTSLTNMNLNSLFRISDSYTCQQMFYNCTSLTSINLDNLTIIGGQSNIYNTCYSMFYKCTSLQSINFSSLYRINGNSTLSSMFSNCTSLQSVSFPKLFSLGNTNIFSNMLSGCSNVTVHFPSNLESIIGSWSDIINGMGGTNTTVLFDLPIISNNNFILDSSIQEAFGELFQYAFYGDTNLITADFSSLRNIDNGYSFRYAFQNCTNLTSVSFENIEKLKSMSTDFSYMFQNCTSLQSVNFSKLSVIQGKSWSGTLYTFYQSSLPSIKFDSLKTLVDGYCLSYAFYNCTSLQSISFPSLKTLINSYGYSSSAVLINMLNGCSNVTVHFPKNLEAKIQKLTGYPNFGGSNTTLTYDLPSVFILTGNNANQYERNPKYDTQTALAWRKKDSGTDIEPIIDWTPFYTSGISDPQIGDTIYLDSACTQVVTTIDSIA